MVSTENLEIKRQREKYKKIKMPRIYGRRDCGTHILKCKDIQR